MAKRKKKLLSIIKNRRIRKSRALLKSFSDIFTPSQLSYLVVLGQSQYHGEISDKFHKEVPSEFKDYRFLMHPNRLSIMKVLYMDFIASSVQIKNELNLSWGEYTSHITALENKGFIRTETTFVNGVKGNIVYLEEIGRKEFETLIGLLQDFLIDVNSDQSDVTAKSTLYPPGKDFDDTT